MRWQFEVAGWFGEVDVLARAQAFEGARPFFGVELPLRFDADPDAEVVDLLEQAELLGDVQGAGGSRLAFLELAPAGIDGS